MRGTIAAGSSCDTINNMADGPHDPPSTPRTFSLRQLMLAVTACAVLAAIVGHTRSIGLGMILLASFQSVLAMGCFMATNRLERDSRPPYQAAYNLLGLFASLLITVAAIFLSLGLLTAVEEVFGRHP